MKWLSISLLLISASAQQVFRGGLQGRQNPVSLAVYDAWANAGAPTTEHFKSHGGVGISDPNSGFIGFTALSSGQETIDWDAELVAGTLTNRASDVMRLRKQSGHFYIEGVGSQSLGGTTGTLLQALDMEITSGRFGYNMVPNSLGRVQIQGASGDSSGLVVFRPSGNVTSVYHRGNSGQTVVDAFYDGASASVMYIGQDFATGRMTLGAGTACGTTNLCLDPNGNLGLLNTLATLQDANTGSHHIIFGETGGSTVEEFTLASNTSGTGNPVGTIDFANYNIGATEKRLIILLGRTDGAANTGALELYYLGAGTGHLFADFKGSTNQFRFLNQASLAVADGQTNLTETSTNATALQVTGAGGGVGGSFTSNSTLYTLFATNTSTGYAIYASGDTNTTGTVNAGSVSVTGGGAYFASGSPGSTVTIHATNPGCTITVVKGIITGASAC